MPVFEIDKFGLVLPYLLAAALTAVFIFVCLKFLALIFSGRKYLRHHVFSVRLSKEKPKEENGKQTAQNLKEEIAKGETIFASIGGMRAERGLKALITGRTDHISFEIVANSNHITFYFVSPYEDIRYIEQQIHAHYPDAVIEEVSDYNSFGLAGYASAAYLKTTKGFVFPLKTYQKMDIDPMNSLINVLSKLDKGESVAIQYIVRSAKRSWHARVRKVVFMIHRKNSVAQGLRYSNPIRSLFYVNFKNDASQGFNAQGKPLKRLSAIEEEMVKSMEEKNLKAGLDVNLRVLSFAKTKERANLYLENIASAFAEYNNFSYGNSFSRAKKRNQDKIIKDFIYRHFRENISFLLNSEELASIFHFPLSTTETPNILWLTAKSAPAPADTPEEGISLGVNTYRGVNREVRIKRLDRRRHTYIVGKSGVGKSVLLANMAIQDIQNGEGVCVIDPHGDLISDILERIPPERAEDVIIFSPADLDRPLALNLLEYDPRYPEQKSFVINEMIGIFDKLYDLKATGGPMFEQYMRNAMLLIMDDPETGSTLMEIPKVLADENFRRLKLKNCKNKTVVDFWIKEAEKAGGEAALANIVPYITSKLTSFVSNDMMRPIIGQQKSAFNLREVMDKQKILLIDLPKGTVGEMNAYLLGMIVVGKILMAALSRTDMPSEQRKDFYLYIDEFQNFTTNSICQILSEARKYALNLVIAHQYIGQLSKNNNDEIKDAVFGNVGTMVSFKVGSEDAEFLVKEFEPVFNEYDLINVGKGTAYIKLLIDNSAARPFSLRTIWPLVGVKRDGMGERIRSLSRLKYGQNARLVEAEISRRSEIKL
ncbi:MAG: type IV secretory system conjugative DNA transfer family protein [Patescibacteria group bacterium]